ncbi:MAG: translation initiation factor 2 [Gammaproteobacteria bacterium]
MRRLVAGALPALVLAGCATMTRGSSEPVQITSDPPGVAARMSTGYSCVTPCTIEVPRKDDFTVVFAAPGYQTMSVPVVAKVAGGGAAGFAGNLLLGGVVGMAVDASTGAALSHVPNPVHATMIPAVPVAVPRGFAPPAKGERRPRPTS